MIINIINKVGQLYKELPELGCKECGLCCVSPTCTLTEFIYTFNYLQKNISPEKLKEYILRPLQLNPDYEGNLRCVFLENNRCAIYPCRTGACRLFGIPSLKELGLLNLEECRNKITVISGKSDISFIKSWLEKLFLLDKGLYNFGAEPYFIKGFNIQCWLDIYFDNSLDFDVFNEIKHAMKQYLDLSQFKNNFKLQTRLKEKIDKIAILSTLLGSGEKEVINKLLLSIRDDYPATGMYFYNEAMAFLEILNKTD